MREMASGKNTNGIPEKIKLKMGNWLQNEHVFDYLKYQRNNAQHSLFLKTTNLAHQIFAKTVNRLRREQAITIALRNPHIFL